MPLSPLFTDLPICLLRKTNLPFPLSGMRALCNNHSNNTTDPLPLRELLFITGTKARAPRE